MARPSPAPPCARVDVPSACSNSSKMRSMSSCRQSRTGVGDGEADRSGGARSGPASTLTSTPPLSVNLMALPIRLSSTCLHPAGVGGDQLRHVGRDVAADADALGEGAARRATRRCCRRSRAATSAAARDRNGRPRSWNSRAGPRSGRATRWPRSRRRRHRCCCSGDRLVSASSLAMPMMPFIGVRISWLTVARKRDLAWLAYSARSRAVISAVSARLRAVMSRAMARCETALAGLVAHRQFDPRKPARAARRADRDIGRTQALAVGKGGVGNDADLDAEFRKACWPARSRWSMPTRSANTLLA